MRWMLLFVVVSGCAWTNNNVKPAQDREAVAEEPAAVDHYRALLAEVQKEIADAKAQESDPVYVECRRQVTESCIRLVDVHQTRVLHLYEHEAQIVDRIKAEEEETQRLAREEAAKPTPLQRALAGFGEREREQRTVYVAPAPQPAPVRFRCQPSAYGNGQVDCKELP